MKAWYANGIRRTPDGHLVPARADLPGIRSRAEERLHIGRDARVGPIDVRGAVIVSQGTHIRGALRGGHEVILGAGTIVDGDVHATGRVVVQAGARTGAIKAGSDVLLVDCQTGDVQAGGDIIIVGSPTTGRLEPGGRVTTRP